MSSTASSSTSEAQNFSVTAAPIALSNREEDELRKTVRAEALKACDPIVKGEWDLMVTSHNAS